MATAEFRCTFRCGHPDASKSAGDGLVTEVILQSVGGVEYFDAAGFPGWTIGIQYKDAPLSTWHWDWPLPRSMSVTISPD